MVCKQWPRGGSCQQVFFHGQNSVKRDTSFSHSDGTAGAKPVDFGSFDMHRYKVRTTLVREERDIIRCNINFRRKNGIAGKLTQPQESKRAECLSSPQ